MKAVFLQLPPQVQEVAQGLLELALEAIHRSGRSEVVGPYLVISHTLGSQYEAGAENVRMGLYYLFGDYADEERTVLIGDPAKGAFVSISPLHEGSPGLGAQELIELGRRVKKTIPLAKAEKLAKEAADVLEPYVTASIVAGSVRRRRPQVGDVELVVLPDDWAAFEEFMDNNEWAGGDRIRKKIVNGTPIELYIAHKPEELGSMLMWFTGDFVFNIAMNAIAKRRGFTRNQYGIWKDEELVFQSPDEREFFDFLGVRWHSPQDRSFKDRPKKKAAMGAEMLIELGAERRKAGHISLELKQDPSVSPMVWVLKIERTDPYGGGSWTGDFAFRDENAAHYWYSQGIQGDEDIDRLVQIFHET